MQQPNQELSTKKESQKNYSFKITSDNKSFAVDFSIISNTLEINIKNELELTFLYKISFKAEDFHKLNKYFRQFDTVTEIFDFIINIEKLEEKIKIKIEDKFADLKIIIPSISKIKENIEIDLIIPEVKLKENELILNLCEKVEKINILENKINALEKKINLIYKYLQIDFENFKTKNNIESNIITDEDFTIVSVGIKLTLNKKIKSAKLLYRASRDGNQTQFHSKCDNKENTVTFVKAINGRRFGGFANKPFCSDRWAGIKDENAFVFSLDFNECYFYNNTPFALYGSVYYGPIWGYGHDLYINGDCLNNNESTTRQSSFNYNGRINALSGGTNFQAEDYETYELILE